MKAVSATRAAPLRRARVRRTEAKEKTERVEGLEVSQADTLTNAVHLSGAPLQHTAYRRQSRGTVKYRPRTGCPTDWKDVTDSMIGPQGATGPAGAAGPKGDRGEQGPQGASGPAVSFSGSTGSNDLQSTKLYVAGAPAAGLVALEEGAALIFERTVSARRPSERRQSPWPSSRRRCVRRGIRAPRR